MDKVIIASGPVIVRDNKVLLDISGEDDFWKFIGGRVAAGETLKEAAARRSREAMGLEIRIINDEPFLMYLPKPGEEEIDVLLVHWLAGCAGEVVPGPGTKEWAWHDLQGLPANLAPNIEPALKHFGYIR
jgi:ADP-ribose pyrophosphatase YjhB (NUDIX family)